MINLKRNYKTYITEPIYSWTTWEFPVYLNDSTDSDMWFLLLEPGTVNEESMFYHRRVGNIVYVYSVNRVTPKDHLDNSQVLLVNSIDYMNYLISQTNEQCFIYKTDNNNVVVKWWTFYINWENVIIDDLVTANWLPDKVFIPEATNYLYIVNWDFKITDTIIPKEAYLVATFYIWVSWSVDSFIKHNTFIVWNKWEKWDKWDQWLQGISWWFGNDWAFAYATITPTEWQTLVTLPFEYVSWNNNLYVYVNWLKQKVTVDYSETSNTSITLVRPLVADDTIEIVYPNKWVNWKWVYSPVVEYIKDDLISYEWNTYICKLQSLNNLPTDNTYWDLFVSKWEKWDKWDQWEQGIQWLQGIQGIQWLQWIQWKSIDSVVSTKVWKTTTVTVTWDFDNSPYVFTIEDWLDWEWSWDMLKAIYDPSNKEKEVAFKDEVDNEILINSQAIAANTQAIANLATAQWAFQNTNTPVFAITATEQTIPFTVSTQSTNIDIFEFNDNWNYISMKKDAPYNFSTNMEFAHTSNALITVTIRWRKVSDNTEVYSRQVQLQADNWDISNVTTSTLITLWSWWYPSSPFDMYFTVQSNVTWITLRRFSSILSAWGSYDIYNIADWWNIQWNISAQTDLQNALDAKANLSWATFTWNITATNLSWVNTWDETAASIKTKYESNSNTNAFTDAEKSKLAWIEGGAEVNEVTLSWNESLTNKVINWVSITSAWDGNSYLANDGSYKTISTWWGNLSVLWWNWEDWSLNISSWTLTIPLDVYMWQWYIEKNYSSITISWTALLNFSWAQARGNLIYLKCRGDFIMSGWTINANWLWWAGWSWWTSPWAAGTSGYLFAYPTSSGHSKPWLWWVRWGSWWTAQLWVKMFPKTFWRLDYMFSWAWGWEGAYWWDNTGSYWWNWWNWWGVIVIEVWWEFIFSWWTISANWNNWANWESWWQESHWWGWWGAWWMIFIFWNKLTTNTWTLSVNWGNWWNWRLGFWYTKWWWGAWWSLIDKWGNWWAWNVAWSNWTSNAYGTWWTWWLNWSNWGWWGWGWAAWYYYLQFNS